MTERTLVLIKPGFLKHTDKILEDILQSTRGKIIFSEILQAVSEETIRRAYEHIPKIWLEGIVRDYSGKDFHMAILEGENIVQKVLDIAGNTDPRMADKSTIRARYHKLDYCISGTNHPHNVMHRSDSPESALSEIEHWMKEKRYTGDSL